MKTHFKGKTTSTNPMYSVKLIHPRVDLHPSCIVKNSACGGENTPQCLVCGIVQVSCTIICMCMIHVACQLAVICTSGMTKHDCQPRQITGCYPELGLATEIKTWDRMPQWKMITVFPWNLAAARFYFKPLFGAATIQGRRVQGSIRTWTASIVSVLVCT